MYRLIFVLLLLALAALVFAAEFETVPMQRSMPVSSIDSRLPGNELPPTTVPLPHILDDTLQSWDFTSPQGWTFTDASDIGTMWHRDTVRGIAGDSAWWCGDPGLFSRGYGDYWFQVVQTPMIDLTSATNPTVGCKLWWALESAGSSMGYDGVTLWVSTDGGATFQVLNGVTPAYTSSRLNAATSICWNLGENVPGYCGMSNGYRTVSASLASYCQDSVVVRWTLLSDRAISGAFRDTLIGAYLDSVRITGGTQTYFSDNGNASANGLRAVHTRGFGHHWEWSNSSYVSAPTSAHCFDNYANQLGCLVSPPISIPMRSVYFTFSVNCDMLDSTHADDPNGRLRHYYQVEVLGPDSIWHWITSDYMRGGHGGSGWYDYVPGSAYGGNTSLNLSLWAGQTIKLRFKVITDYDITPAGTGLWIDNVRIMGDSRELYDLEPVHMYIPFPTTVGVTPSSQDSLRIHNFSRGVLTNVAWDMRLDTAWVTQDTIPVALPDSEFIYTFSIPLTTPGVIHPAVRIPMPTDPVTYKSLYMEDVIIQPEHFLEIGYDNRLWTKRDTLPANMHYAEMIVPSSVGVSGTYHVAQIRFATFGGPATAVHAKLMTSTSSRPGVTLVDTLVTIPQSPDSVITWHTVDISGRAESRNRTGTSFVVLTPPDAPLVMPYLAVTDTLAYGGSRAYRWAGGTARPVLNSHDQAIRVVVEWPVTSSAPEHVDAPLPTTLALSAYPNPFNSTTHLSVSIPKSGMVELAVFDVTGRQVASLYRGNLSAGTYRYEWRADRYASGVYFVRINADNTVKMQKVSLLK